MSAPVITPDFVVSHYRVLHALGTGGMGEVYEGLDETLKRRVAMKAIRREKRLDREAKARFLREARILSQLDHPHICRVYDYIETDDRDWLVLELIDGRTLRAAIADGLGAVDRIAIARQIASVLAAMHAAGVVHRDLKPGNVMLTEAGTAKVLDFGLSATVASKNEEGAGSAVGQLAWSAAEDPPSGAPLADSAWARAPMDDVDLSTFQSRTGSVLGTFAYMSPEQGRGEGATAASDMYSYGLVLEELFTGQLAFGSPDDRGVTVRQPDRVAPDVAALIAKLKSAAPSHRPTADDVVERLTWIADAPRRLRRRLAVAAVLLLAVAGAAKYTWDLARERAAAVAARDEANRRREQAEGLIGFMVGDLRTRLTSVGRLDLLDDVGRRALEYFATVPADSLTGEEQHRRSQTLHQLGQVRQARADLPGALKAYEESLALAQAVAAMDPGNAAWQLGLGTSYFYVGDMKRRRGDLEGALKDFRAYQDIARRLVERDPSNVEWKLELSYGYSNVAAILSARGDLEGAREQLELTRALQAEIALAKPKDTAIQLSRANNQNRLGVVLQRLGRFADAARSFEAEVEIYRGLSAGDPRNTQFLRRVPISRRFLAQMRRALGDPEAALEQYTAALAVSRELAERDPTNVDWQRDLALGEMFMGRALIDTRQFAAALSHYQISMAQLKPLMAKSAVQPEVRRDVAAGHNGMAEILLTQGQSAAALRELEAAEAVLAPLMATSPGDATTARLVAAGRNVRGRILNARGENGRAREAWMSSVTVLAPFVAGTTDYFVIDPYVHALVFLGRTDEARPFFERLSALGYRERELMKFWSQASGS